MYFTRLIPAFKNHQRKWSDFLYAYPVVSRRARGVSIGINLSPDKSCNFDCVYCEVDRQFPEHPRAIHLNILEYELRNLIERCQSGKLFLEEPFASVPLPLRRLNDIAFSGNGEPTMFHSFAEMVDCVARVKQKATDPSVKLVLITNASGLHRTEVQRGLTIMDANQGEIWAKLDAGTEAYYRKINRAAPPFDRILMNITIAARERPLCIQSLFLRIEEDPPSTEELRAYCDRLCEFKSAGCKIKEVQIYTVARTPREYWAAALSEPELKVIQRMVVQTTGLPVECYTGLT